MCTKKELKWETRKGQLKGGWSRKTERERERAVDVINTSQQRQEQEKNWNWLPRIVLLN